MITTSYRRGAAIKNDRAAGPGTYIRGTVFPAGAIRIKPYAVEMNRTFLMGDREMDFPDLGNRYSVGFERLWSARLC